MFFGRVGLWMTGILTPFFSLKADIKGGNDNTNANFAGKNVPKHSLNPLTVFGLQDFPTLSFVVQVQDLLQKCCRVWSW